MRHQGRITQWKDEQGYGFIAPNGGGECVFLHIKAFRPRQPRPAGDEIVSYTLSRDPAGRPCAAAVTFVRGRERATVGMMAGPGAWALGSCGVFVAGLILSALGGKLPMTVLSLYASASVITFVAYGLDKRAARNGRWRTRESTLHLLALLGGWPGALLAQKTLRHKSAKTSFLAMFWITVLLNGGALYVFLTSHGAASLRAALSIP